jgi:glutamate racemase
LASGTQKAIKIGLFDSGVGGLSVLRQLQKLSTLSAQPLEFYYVGDTARCPYGNRPADEIRSFVSQIIGWLSGHHVDHIVMACNTSAAVGYSHAKKLSSVPVHDLITPASRYVASRFSKIAVLATQSTAQSQAFSMRIKTFAPNVEVVEVGCPKLVPLVESGELTGEKATAALAEYVAQVADAEAIILGCTHFPFLAQALQPLLRDGVVLVDPAEMLLEEIAGSLAANNNGASSARRDVAPLEHCSFFVTGSSDSFASTAEICLGYPQSTLAGSGRVQSLDVAALVASEIIPEAAEATLHTISNVVPMSKNDSKAAR